jgi:hypothetical protein
MPFIIVEKVKIILTKVFNAIQKTVEFELELSYKL